MTAEKSRIVFGFLCLGADSFLGKVKNCKLKDLALAGVRWGYMRSNILVRVGRYIARKRFTPTDVERIVRQICRIVIFKFCVCFFWLMSVLRFKRTF